MAKISSKDRIMLNEAYDLMLLAESMPSMTLKQVIANLDLMSESQLNYVSTVNERILNEFWRGGAGVLGAAGRGIANAAKSVGGAVKGAVSGGIEAGKQVGKNVGNMYKQSEIEGQANDSIKKARELTQQLIDLVVQAQQNNLIKAQKPVTEMSLEELVDNLETAKQSAETFKNHAMKKGFTGDVGKAFKKGYSSGSAPKQAPENKPFKSALPPQANPMKVQRTRLA